MSCHVEVREFAGKPATMFFCGPTPPKRRCRFCGRRATRLCDWKAERKVNLHPAQLRAGDTYVTQGGQNLPVQVVSRFSPSLKAWQDYGAGLTPRNQLNLLTGVRRRNNARRMRGLSAGRVTMFGITYKTGQSFLFYRRNHERIPVLRKVLCSAPCCWRCSRRVGPETDYCMEHWKAWEAIQ